MTASIDQTLLTAQVCVNRKSTNRNFVKSLAKNGNKEFTKHTLTTPTTNPTAFVMETSKTVTQLFEMQLSVRHLAIRLYTKLR